MSQLGYVDFIQHIVRTAVPIGVHDPEKVTRIALIELVSHVPRVVMAQQLMPLTVECAEDGKRVFSFDLKNKGDMWGEIRVMTAGQVTVECSRTDRVNQATQTWRPFLGPAHTFYLYGGVPFATVGDDYDYRVTVTVLGKFIAESVQQVLVDTYWLDLDEREHLSRISGPHVMVPTLQPLAQK